MRTMSQTASKKCEKCGADCERDEADVGVGILYGPWGCPECGWSEVEAFDCSGDNGPMRPWEDHDGWTLNQFGRAFPPDYRESASTRLLFEILDDLGLGISSDDPTTLISLDENLPEEGTDE